MPERSEYPPGMPSWVDLATTDVDAAKDFYTALLGWSYQDEDAGEFGTYTMALSGGRPAAGMFNQPEEQRSMGIPPTWNTYVTVDDADAAAAAAKAAGGNVMMPPMDVMEAGRMAVLQDPTGAAICVWQAKANAGTGVVAEPGAYAWSELLTGDQDAAAAFYAALFGWQATDMATPDGQPAKLFRLDGAPAASARGLPVEGVPPHWFNYFVVEDADAAAATIGEKGGKVFMGPFDTPPGRVVVGTDAAGAGFAVIQPDPDFDPSAM